MMDGQRDRVVGEGRKLAVDVLYSEKAHFAAAGRWRYWQFWLGIGSASLAALAGASFLSKIFDPAVQEWLPAVLAFMASLMTTLSTILKPDQIWEKHHSAGVEYGILRRKIRHFVQIDAQAPDMAEGDLRQMLAKFEAEVGVVQKRARPIPGYAHRTAYKSIHGGQADYTDAELDAATGVLE